MVCVAVENVSKNYLQDYINEFCYRFYGVGDLPHRLLNACITHAQIRLA